MSDRTRKALSDPETRLHFGANLGRLIAESGKSQAEICKELAIHGTQLNRFLQSQSFPRPDVLQAICVFFGVDARILTTDFESYQIINRNAFPSSILGNPQPASMINFPDGFYEEWRPLLPCNFDYACHLFHVCTLDDTRVTRVYATPTRVKKDGDLERFGERLLITGVAIHQAGGVLIIDNQYGSVHYTITALKYGSYGSPTYFPGHKKSVSAITDGRRLMKSATVLNYIGDSLSAALNVRRQPIFRKSDETPTRVKVILEDMEQIYDLG